MRMTFVRLVLTTTIVFHGAAVSAQQHAVATEQRAARSAVDSLLRRRIVVHLDAVPLAQALRTIGRLGGAQIAYDPDAISVVKTVVTLHASVTVMEALNRALVGTMFEYATAPNGQIAVVRRGEERQGFLGAVVGRVIDARTRKAIAGAKVVVDGASRGVVTDPEGGYKVQGLGTGSHIISATYLGYVRQSRTVAIADGETASASFELQVSANQLDQVVVTGTVIPTERKAVPNAMTVITAKELEQRGITQIDQLFRGDVPGVFASYQGSATSLGAVTMYVRGTTALSNGRSAGVSLSTNPIKTYVDGVEIADPHYLSQIDPKSIDRIEIVTGPQASTIYGSNALNGVRQIFTKRGLSSKTSAVLDLQSGWIQNNFSTSLAPQHLFTGQLNGIEGRLSYNAGATWDYRGQWTPGLQSTRTSVFGGVRGEWRSRVGAMTADVTMRRALTHEYQRGDVTQAAIQLQATGIWNPGSSKGRISPRTSKLDGQTFGFTLGYRPTSWWSHQLVVGRDVVTSPSYTTAAGYTNGGPMDTTLSYNLYETQRWSMTYTTTPQVPLGSIAVLTTTLGADAWNSLTLSASAQPQALVGTLDQAGLQRQPSHNAGGFVKSQLGLGDRLFLTYGLRAEWNPAFGENVKPNIAPEYGVAYTQDFGSVTAKLRGSYGRATRPPTLRGVRGSQLEASDGRIPYYGNYYIVFPNTDLLPEHQQGGEGGVELYFGTRASLVLTRYNQTVDNLIETPVVDSVRSLLTLAEYGFDPAIYAGFWPDGYLHENQYKYVNIGNIRNQGWELQGSANAGPLTVNGKYSFTKSRVIGITQAFAASFPASQYPDYQPGSTFQWIPEHTWAATLAYTRRSGTVTLSMNGIGPLLAQSNTFTFEKVYTRLSTNSYRMSLPETYRYPQNGYIISHLNATQRLSGRVEGVLQIQNLLDFYQTDLDAGAAAIGRQTKFGARIRF
jgi:outer membrane receptor protein involved in Fe transport